jgi:glycosyltransferase involved in cell wall biosynthesis
MRILITSQSLPPKHAGGVEMYVTMLIRSLLRFSGKKTLEVHLLTSIDSWQEVTFITNDILSKDRIKVIPLRISSTLPRTLAFELSLNSFLRKYKDIVRREYDVIHIQSGDIFLSSIRRSINSKVVCTFHGNHALEIKTTFTNRHVQTLELSEIIMELYFSVLDFLAKPSYTNAIVGIFPSTFLYNCYKKIYKGKAQIAPHPIDIDFINSILNQEVPEHEKALLRDLRKYMELKEFIILFHGRLVYRKGIFHLLKALEILLNKDTRLREKLGLIIIGTGFVDRVLRTYINSKGLGNSVIMVGRVSMPLLYRLIKLADMVAIPSLYEAGVPYAALEVLALRKPLMISNLPFITEFLDFKDAILVNPCDPISLSETLHDIIYSGQRELRKIADRGYLKIERIFSPSEYYKKIVTTYEEIAGGIL